MTAKKSSLEKSRMSVMELKSALAEKDHAKVKKILTKRDTVFFPKILIKIDFSKETEATIFKTAVPIKDRGKLNEAIMQAVNQVVRQRNMNQILFPRTDNLRRLHPKLGEVLHRRRLFQIEGMHSPYFIQMLPPTRSLFTYALEHFDAECFQRLLKSTQVNAINLRGPGRHDSPLIIAIRKKNKTAVEMLLNSPHMSLAILGKHKNALHRTPVGLLVSQGDLELAIKVLQKTKALYRKYLDTDVENHPVPVSIYYQDPMGQSLISLAAASGRQDVLQGLLEYAQNNIAQYPTLLINAMHAAIKSKKAESIKRLLATNLYPVSRHFLLDCKAKPHPELETYVLKALSVKCTSCLQYMIDSPLFQEQVFILSPNSLFLLRSVATGSLEIVKSVIEHPYFTKNRAAFMRQRTTLKHKNALHLAIDMGNINIVKYLAANFPALLFDKDHYLHTPLYYAAVSNKKELLAAMLDERIMNGKLAQGISNILRKPDKRLQNDTIDYLREQLLEYDRTHHSF